MLNGLILLDGRMFVCHTKTLNMKIGFISQKQSSVYSNKYKLLSMFRWMGRKNST